MPFEMPPQISSERFAPAVDMIYLSSDSKKKSIRQGLTIRTDFRPYAKENVTQDGIVRYIPKAMTDGTTIDVVPGDHVYTHHFLCDKDTALKLNGEYLYPIDYKWHVFCKIVDGVPVMLRDWVLVEPYNDERDHKTPSGLYITTTQKHSGRYGRIKHLNEETRAMGVKEGDMIVFNQDSDYEMEVEGETLLRMKNRDIDAIL